MDRSGSKTTTFCNKKKENQSAQSIKNCTKPIEVLLNVKSSSHLITNNLNNTPISATFCFSQWPAFDSHLSPAKTKQSAIRLPTSRSNMNCRKLTSKVAVFFEAGALILGIFNQASNLSYQIPPLKSQQTNKNPLHFYSQLSAPFSRILPPPIHIHPQ